MQYISSDTNVWIDFVTIRQAELPFRLPYTYLMETTVVDDELLSPPTMKDILLRLGLQRTELSAEEYELAEGYSKYRALSTPDRVALAIAKSRDIPLLTGDKALRNAAQAEKGEFIGTLGILDALFEQQYVSSAEYISVLKDLQKFNGKGIRLPSSEIEKRLNAISIVE